MDVPPSLCYTWNVRCKIIAYLRVSTDRQGKSGLGLAAQAAAIAQHVTQAGCELLATYTEVETGKRDTLENRPELRNAIAHSKRTRATLVVAKLDRLARSVAVTSLLHQSGIDFVCVDNPSANRLTVQILSAVAEAEAQSISDRTKAALAAYKNRGGKLGASLPQCRKLTLEDRKKGANHAGQRHTQLAKEAYTDLSPVILDLRHSGHSLRAVARLLNGQGHTTRRNKAWNPMQVKRVLERAT
jgi:DNA invertase Pin-like site-specific DNA recombinase